MEGMANELSSVRRKGTRHAKFWGKRLVAKGQPVGSARGWTEHVGGPGEAEQVGLWARVQVGRTEFRVQEATGGFRAGLGRPYLT